MQCLSCQNDIADDAAVCPHCDTVLDPSLLDASGPDQSADGDATEAKPAPTRTPAIARPQPARPGGAKMPPRRPPPKPRATATDDEPPPSRRGPPMVAHMGPDKVLDPEELLSSIKHFIVSLPSADKLAFFGTLALAFSCFLPWKETTSEGEVLGLFTYGALTLLLAAAALTALVLRTRNPGRSVMTYWVIQLAGVGVGLLWCFISLKLVWDKTLSRSAVGNVETWASTPSFGLVLGIVAGIVAAVGTVGGLTSGENP